MVIFHCYVSSPEGNLLANDMSIPCGCMDARADVAQFSCWICPGNVTARRRQSTGRPCRAGLGSKESSAAGTAAPHRASKQSPWGSRLDAAPRLCLKMRNCYFHSENDCQ